MGCSTKCCSIEERVAVSSARSRRVCGPTRSVPTGVGATGLIIDPNCEQDHEFSGSGGRIKEKIYDIANNLEDHGVTTGGQVAARAPEEKTKHVPPSVRALTQRLLPAPCLRSQLTYFGLDQPQMNSLECSVLT